jgi:hypothetical protein
MIRGERQIGRMPTSIAPSLDMQSAAWALEAVPKLASNAVSGRFQPARTRNPTLPAIGYYLLKDVDLDYFRTGH